MLSGVSGLLLSTFFAFSQARRRRRLARALLRTSILYLSLNSSHRWLNSAYRGGEGSQR